MNNMNAMSSRQIKAARALLDWSQEDLATATQLSIATIRKLELGYISPRQATTSVIRQTLESAGLEFMDNDGVRRRPVDIMTFQGQQGLTNFLDDIQQTIKRNGGDIFVIDTSHSYFFGWKESGTRAFFEQIVETIGSTSIKCVFTDFIEIPVVLPRIEFRFISKNYIDSIPFCVYGEKFAIIVGNKHDSKIIVTNSPLTAQASKHQFLSIWEKATPFLAHLNTTEEKLLRRA